MSPKSSRGGAKALWRREFNRFVEQVLKPKRGGREAPVLLVEAIKHAPQQIAVAHMATVITHNSRVKPVAYADPVRTDFRLRHVVAMRLAFLARSLFSKNFESTYRSLGVRSLVTPDLRSSHLARAKQAQKEFFESGATKRDIENYTLEGVKIGDLIYDDYLKKVSGTFDPASEQFQNYFHESLKVFFFWLDFFEKHRVQAVVGNSVYRAAIVPRLALSRNVDVFDAQITRVVRLGPTGLQYEDSWYYKDDFSQLPDSHLARSRAKQALVQKRRGVPDIFNAHISAPTGIRSKEQLIQASDKPKILIAPHCFADSAHSFGNMLFPDFYEWLVFLAGIASSSSYDWYLKPHPRAAEDLPVIRRIFDDVPRVKILPLDASLDQLAEEGVSVVLTMRGHVGFDFPLSGIPVISCTPGSRYRSFSFNINASSEKEYRNLLNNVESLPVNIEEQELEEFYFMDVIHNHPNLFLPDTLTTQKLWSGRPANVVFENFLEAVDFAYTRRTLHELALFSRSTNLRFRRSEG